MILVFGGTTEGKKVIQVLEERKQTFIYSTKTKVEVVESKWLKYRFGALNKELMQELITHHKVSKIIDAAHPFAEELHQTIATVAQKCSISVIRFGRKPIHIENENGVYWVKNYAQAQELLFNQFQEKKVLGLTGVQTIQKFEKWWKKYPSWFRILPRNTSIRIAEEVGFPKEQLILSMPNQEEKEEVKLMKEKSIDVVMTKESGASGFLQTKVRAANACNIPIIIIQEPKIPSSFQVVYTVSALDKLMN